MALRRFSSILLRPNTPSCLPRGIPPLRSISPYSTTASFPDTRIFLKPDKRSSLFQHDSGRWLWKEEEQLRKRYRAFNVEELEKAVAKAVGVETCELLGKGDEGHFNKAFPCQLPDGRVVVARIPNPQAGPAFRTTASEVATMDFVRTIIDLPVPRVLAWSAEAANPVESEYIVMENVQGEQLGNRWDHMDMASKAVVVAFLVQAQAKLLSASFNLYGALYYADHAPSGSLPLELYGNFSDATKADARKRFVIGPVADRNFYDGERADMNIDRGPWRTAEACLKALAAKEIEWLSKYADPSNPPFVFSPGLVPSGDHTQPEAHAKLYRRFIQVAPYLHRRAQETPQLYHQALNFHNIFVEDMRISGIIDWQNVTAIPVRPLAELPQIVAFGGEMEPSLPAEYHETKDDDEKRRIREESAKSHLLTHYRDSIQVKIPGLAAWLCGEGWYRIRNLMWFVQESSWEEQDLAKLRFGLIGVAKNWEVIAGKDVPCPIDISEEDEQRNEEEGREYNETADCWDRLNLGRDGYIRHELYDEMLTLFRDMRDFGLKQDEILADKDAKEVWEKSFEWLQHSKLTTEE